MDGKSSCANGARQLEIKLGMQLRCLWTFVLGAVHKGTPRVNSLQHYDGLVYSRWPQLISISSDVENAGFKPRVNAHRIAGIFYDKPNDFRSFLSG